MSRHHYYYSTRIRSEYPWAHVYIYIFTHINLWQETNNYKPSVYTIVSHQMKIAAARIEWSRKVCDDRTRGWIGICGSGWSLPTNQYLVNDGHQCRLSVIISPCLLVQDDETQLHMHINTTNMTRTNRQIHIESYILEHSSSMALPHILAGSHTINIRLQ